MAPSLAVQRLNVIVRCLAEFQRRATYQAIGQLLYGIKPPGGGRQGAALMNGLPRSPRYAWIVNAESKFPTGYSNTDIPTEFEKHPQIIETGARLKVWLQTNFPESRWWW